MTAKKNKKALVSLLSINIGFVFVSLVVGCFAWFSVADEFDPFNIKSSVVTAYFDSRTSSGADGTQDNPFVITRPVHYYNLVQLTLSDKKFNVNGEQKYFWEAGYYFEFGKDFDGDGDKEFYDYDDNGVIQEGKTSNYLNLEYYRGSRALEPLGNAAKPFIAHIDGNNLTVQNIHITGNGRSDIGIFGYVTNPGYVKNLYFDTVDIDVKQPALTDSNAFYHPLLDEKTNIGFIAGHVSTESLFSDVYINNCKIRNSVFASEAQRDDYGFFGYTESNSTPTPAGESFEYDIDAPSVYSYFNNSYSGIAGSSLLTRNVDPDFQQGTTFSDAVSSSGSNYNLQGSHYGTASSASDYPLGSIGYQENDNMVNVWIKRNSDYESIPGGVEQPEFSDDEPGDVGGHFLYHDGEQWRYYECVPGQTTNRDLHGHFYYYMFFAKHNPNIIRNWMCNNYVNGGTYVILNKNSYQTAHDDFYYFSFSGNGNSGNVTYQTWNPGNNKVIFCEGVGDFPGDHNDPERDRWVSTEMSRTVYIYIPSRLAYIYVDKTTRKLKFGPYEDAINPDKSLACKFSQCGAPGGMLSFKSKEEDANGNKVTRRYIMSVTGNELIAQAYTGNQEPAYISYGAGNQSDSGTNIRYVWQLVSNAADIKNGDYITFTYSPNINNTPTEIMSAKKAGNNRASIGTILRRRAHKNCTEWWGGQYTDGVTYVQFNEKEHCMLKVDKRGNKIYLLDEKNNGYLYGGSSKGNYLRLMDTDYVGTDPASEWNIAVDKNSSLASISCNGASGAANNLKFDKDNLAFTCFPDTGTYTGERLYIFKRIDCNNTPVNFKPEPTYYFEGNDENAHGMHTGPITTYSFDVYESAPGTQNYSVLRASPDEIPESQWDFEYTDSESTSVIVMAASSQSGWFRCSDITDLKIGDEYVFVVSSKTTAAIAGNPVENGYMTPCSSGLEFSDNRRVIDTVAANSIIFRLGGSREDGYTFRAENATFLATSAKGSVNVSATGDTRWNVTFSGSGYANVQSLSSDFGRLAYNIDADIFSTYTLGQDIMLYHNTTKERDETYVADVITQDYDGLYNPDMIDVFGGVTFSENSFIIDDGYDIKSPKWHDTNDAGYGLDNTFYRTHNLSGCIAVFIPNLGSLDLGTLHITGSGSAPVFVKGTDLDEDNRVVGLESRIISGDNEGASGAFDYSISLNVYNIFAASYCALDANGNMVAGYDATGEQMVPSATVDFNDIKTFVVVLAADSGTTTNISNVDYKFNAITGNMANFGRVGYRTATYVGGSTDNHGNEVTESSVVTGPILSLSYQVPEDASVFCSVTYVFEPSENRYVYNITFHCSETTRIMIFNFDAQREYVKVNGVRYKGAYNVVTITGETPPSGGWTK